MTKRKAVTCPGCSATVTTPRTACIIEALYDVVIERGNVTKSRALAHFAECDADGLWSSSIGPLIDEIEDEILEAARTR